MPENTDATITDYFNFLLPDLCSGQYDEGELTRQVELPRNTNYLIPPLLQLLGYGVEPASVEPQYGSFQMGVGKHKVDFRLGVKPHTGTKPHYWMLDLKHPAEDCRRPDHVGQLGFYMEKDGVPLGVLFNGREAFAFINHTVKGLTRYARLAGVPVLVAVRNNVMSLVEFFSQFRLDPERPQEFDTMRLAQKLAQRKIKELEKEGRTARIREAIAAALERIGREPDAEVMEFLLARSPELQEMRPCPTAHAMLNAWKADPPSLAACPPAAPAPGTRARWEKVVGTTTMTVVDDCLALLQQVSPGVEPKYNQHYIGLAEGGQACNYVVFYPKRQFVRAECRTSDWAADAGRLHAAGFSVLRNTGDSSWVRFRISTEDAARNKGVLVNVFRSARSARYR